MWRFVALPTKAVSPSYIRSVSVGRWFDTRQISRYLWMQGVLVQFSAMGAIGRCSTDGVPGVTQIWATVSDDGKRLGRGVVSILAD